MELAGGDGIQYGLYFLFGQGQAFLEFGEFFGGLEAGLFQVGEVALLHIVIAYGKSI